MEKNIQLIFNKIVGINLADVIAEVEELRKAYPSYSKKKLSEKFASRIVHLYTSEGVATSLPGAIPGIGTGTQIAVEIGTVSADLIYMLRCMKKICLGIGYIYGKDMSNPGNNDLIIVLGMWCGVINVVRDTTEKVLNKIALKQFAKVPAEVFKKINARISANIFAKYGTKRAPIAVGKLIPFGVGCCVAGTFNYCTLNAFKKKALSYYGSDENAEFVVA